MVSRRFRWCPAAFVFVAIVAALAGGSAAATGDRPLSPLSWTCTMHPEVVTDKAGKCPVCGMTLVPVRLDLVWTCQVHREVAAADAGTCPRCGRDLIRVIKAVSWTCRFHPKVNELNPGSCPVCRRPLTIRYSDRPHGDHNPKHGGLFFMAPNNWHVEGTHPANGVFRLYAYDEYSKPFVPSAFSGRLIVPPAAGSKAPAEPVTFHKVAGRQYLEARAAGVGVPATVAVTMRFQASDPEYRFDFQFVDYSTEPAAPQR